MVNRNLLRQYDLPEDELQQELDAAFDRKDGRTNWLPAEEQDVRGQQDRHRPRRQRHRRRGRGRRRLQERRRHRSSTSGTTKAPTRSCRRKPGDEIQVLLEAVEDETGAIVLSYRKAKRQKEWEDDHRQAQGRRRRLRPGHPQDQGRPAGQHRRQRLPARQPGGHPPAAGHRRLHRQDHRVQDPQDRRGPPQHRRQPPQAASRTSATR